MTRRPPRRGYAMLAVLVFLALLLAISGLTQRQLASALRLEKARAQARLRDEGSVHAAAQALDLLETGLPPSDHYVCGATIDTSLGSRAYTVTFSRESADIWSVEVRPSEPWESPPPMPASFGL